MRYSNIEAIKQTPIEVVNNKIESDIQRTEGIINTVINYLYNVKNLIDTQSRTFFDNYILYYLRIFNLKGLASSVGLELTANTVYNSLHYILSSIAIVLFYNVIMKNIVAVIFGFFVLLWTKIILPILMNPLLSYIAPFLPNSNNLSPNSNNLSPNSNV